MKTKNTVYLNEKVLRFKELHVVGQNADFIGVMPSREAFNRAKEEGLDILIVSITANPPVAKILDYGQYKYTQDKLQRLHKKHKQDTKEIKFGPYTQQHDLNTLLKRAVKFLEEGDKVKLTCSFKFRELEHPELGWAQMKIMLDALKPYAIVENEPSLQGKLLSSLLAPIK